MYLFFFSNLYCFPGHQEAGAHTCSSLSDAHNKYFKIICKHGDYMKKILYLIQFNSLLFFSLFFICSFKKTYGQVHNFTG